MEVGIPQSLSALEKSFLPTSRLSLESNVLDVKLASTSQFNDKDDEGEIMLLAMILLQLHGVPKLPITTTTVVTVPTPAAATAPSTPTATTTVTATATIVPATPASPTSDDDDLGNKKKRQRTSPDQLAILEQIFQTDKMPNPMTRGQLADQLGMSSRRVQIWFQNKRAKVKRSSMKQDGDCPSPTLLSESSSSIPPPSPTSECNTPSPSSPSSPAPATTTITNATSPSPSSANSTPSLTVFTSSTTSTTTATSDTILADTTNQLKAQQQQFSLKSPFVENQLLLAASY